MNLFNLLMNKNKNSNTELLPLIQATPNEQGGLNAQVSQWQAPPTKSQKVFEAIFGKAAAPTDNITTQTVTPVTMKDEITGENVTYAPQNISTISQNPRVGGLFNDIANGAKENYTTGFAAPNLYDSKTSEGSDKGFAYRLGEGLGTLGRFAQSPLGRGLITAGIVGATGGNGLQAVTYGGQAGALNQQLRSADKLYREQLKDNYGFTDEQLDSTRGYIRPDTFNNLTKSQNSAMNLAIRQQASQSMNNLRALQAEKLRIMNSTLPEMQKAKLLQENAKAAHAEEMQLARINYYNNVIANRLGWANYGLKLEEQNRKNKETDADIGAMDKMLDGGSTPSTIPKGGTTKSGNKWKEVN